MINAKNIFYNTIKNTLVDYDITNTTEANDNKLKNILRIYDKYGIGFSMKYLEKIGSNTIKNEGTKVIQFENKFRYVDSNITYYNKQGNKCKLQQVFVFDNQKKRNYC